MRVTIEIPVEKWRPWMLKFSRMFARASRKIEIVILDGRYWRRMRTIAIDTEYDYCSPFLATTTDDEMVSRVYRTRVLSQKNALKKVCENRNIRKVFHHATGDIFQLRNIGIKVADPVECTLIASNLVDENFKLRNLKKLVNLHLGIETKESNRLKGAIKKSEKQV